MHLVDSVEAASLIEPQITVDGVHVWPFEDSFPIDVTSLIFDHRTNLRLNRHDYFELFYVQEGEMIWQFHDQYLPLRKGNLFLVNNAYYHGPINRGEYPCNSRALALYFMPELLQGSERAIEDVEYLAPFICQTESFPFFISEESAPEIVPEIVQLMKKIEQVFPAETTRHRITVKTYLKMILVHLLNHFAENGGVPKSYQKRRKIIEQLQPLFEYLEEHYADEIKVEDASRVLRMSRSCFMRFFKKATGQTFISYLNSFRIAKAQEFLSSTEDSISEISQRVGFCDQSYFGLVFRKTVNMTPLQYREKMSNSEPALIEKIGEYGSIQLED